MKSSDQKKKKSEKLWNIKKVAVGKMKMKII